MSKVIKISSFLVVLVSLFLLASCAPKNVEKAKERLEGMGFNCEVATDEELEGVNAEIGFTIKGCVYGFNEDSDAKIELYLMGSKADAQKLAEYLEAELEKEEPNIQIVIIQRGKWVARSTDEQAAQKAIK